MKEGETRKFMLDKGKPKCQLLKDGIKEITIGKFKSDKEKNYWKYILVEPKLKNVIIECWPGKIDFLFTKGKAEGCGIGKILMNLCLNEESIHNVQNNEDNKASKKLESAKILNETPEFEELYEWVNSQCSKLVFLLMIAKNGGGFVYFNSAEESKYSQMFIMDGSDVVYPKSGSSSVVELKKKYTIEGNIVENGVKIKILNKNWFFCLPKNSAL